MQSGDQSSGLPRRVARRAFSLSLALATTALLGQPRQKDVYPEVHALLMEAESLALSNHITQLEDRTDVPNSVARMLAQAGYWQDAAKRLPPAPLEKNYLLWESRVIYGDAESVGKTFEALPSPLDRSHLLYDLGDLEWKMGQAEAARHAFEQARASAVKIADPAQRAKSLRAIDQSLARLGEEPPIRISPAPRRLNPGASMFNQGIPMFPITTDGFRPLDPREKEAQNKEQGVFMTDLYTKMAAGDRAGLDRLIASAKTPMQKTIAMASVEHLMIQAGRPLEAEALAKEMPEENPDSQLAKSEALGAAAAAWARTGDKTQAALAFSAAAATAERAKELPMGQVSVLVGIAREQFKSGLLVGSEQTLRSAQAQAAALPATSPKSPGGRVRVLTTQTRVDGLEKILEAAIQTRNYDLARELAGLLVHSDSRSAIYSVVRPWIQEGKPEEAIAFARSLAEPIRKVEALLDVARTILWEANAPDL